ncbi:PAS domain S-box-containing protein [Sedimentibacter acidaminivorans]|uniref:PAS domain S-box-containing protein n=1 Tax=Sedimentibacter acidaminivorans TaxID=913099 RepID=A0ABS4GI82_9FIRM|nr:sigma 54-interacting transcriptional regulator [Sedimentibacter acidaminivorans]MBP1927415.1 PAS domain S-box-containing protein [Sedimentibacter acidaminivorans]
MLKIPKECIELIFEQSGIIAITDENAKYIYVNKRWQQDTGILESEAIGKYACDLIDGSRAMAAIQSKKSYTADYFIRKKDGSSLPGIMTYKPILKNNEVLCCFIFSSFLSIDQAYHFLEKIETINAQYEFLKSEMLKRNGAKYSLEDIIGKSDAIKKLKEQIYQAGSSDSTVLISGETGTGKEIVAHSIHSCSLRNIFPFVKVNCSAIPPSLMESEFFGYEEGTFTGAKKGGRRGKFEKAHLGSIFLDEINQLDLSMQPKLLRVLQEKEIERLGSSESISIDSRVIAATNVSLEEMIKNNKFREDLYYRLNIINIFIPSIRDRSEDIPLLANNIISKLNIKMGREIEGISREALEYLKQRNWPGNVRELQNIIERAINVSWKNELNLEDFKKEEKLEAERPRDIKREEFTYNDIDKPLTERKRSLEKEAILKTLKSCNNNKSKTAKVLGISRTLLYQKLEKYKIS